ncbi:antA/AntB antirepressor family protein [Bacillus toyonensis]|uniref:antA/AntB antirepressor family protein n=1 Tax=Bacillus toyonensis TaxID=155322 RepID=UPI0020FFFDA9|nr:antA/AntB antirepressor family protein [Bacillus toyonensis]
MSKLTIKSKPQFKLFEDGIVRVMVTDKGQKVVNGRDLYEGLKVKDKYATWLKRRVEKYGFIENDDYVSLSQKCEGNNATRIEHILTLNMAKELAMVENNEQGRMVRRYFIEVEERASGKKQPKPRKKPVNLIFRQEMDIAKTIASVAGVKEGMAYAVAIERAEKKTGENFSSYKRLLPNATHETGFLNPAQIGERMGLKSRGVNQLLLEKGLQVKEGKEWRLTNEGKIYAEEMPFTRNGHSSYQIRWSERVVDVLKVKCE